MIFQLPELQPPEIEAIERIDELRQAMRWRVAEPRRWRSGLRRLVFARAVQKSNSIEGYNASVDDAMAAIQDEEPLDAEIETVHAIQGYRDAMTYILQLAEDGDELEVDESLLKSLHFMMLKYDLRSRPGRWRNGAVFVRREPGDRIVYEGADAERVPDLMRELVECLEQSEGPAVVRAAMAHLNLVMIHPFKDGNGRMGRCLQTLVLARERIVAPVFSSIEEYLGNHTEDYYAVLGEVGQGAWHPHNDPRPWLRFCLNAHFQQARRVLWLAQEAEELWGRNENLAQDLGLPERVVGPLCDAARRRRLRNWSYRVAVEESEGYEIDSQTASRDLRMLVDAGLLEPQGEKRGRFYLGTEVVRRERDEIRRRMPSFDAIDLFTDAGTQLRLGELAS
jgi:Fic family protein